MTTKALLFDISCYKREELSHLNKRELYETAKESAGACIMSLDDLSYNVNEDMICLDNYWLYFAKVKKEWH